MKRGAPVVLAILALLGAGCISVEKDHTQCTLDDGWGGTRTVFDPSGECATNNFFFPDWQDLGFAASNGTLTVTSVYDAGGTHPRDWSEFTATLDRTFVISAPQTPAGVSLDGTPAQSIPEQGLRLPPRAVKIGDTLRFCVEPSNAKPLDGFQVALTVDHARRYRASWQLGPLASCDGTGIDARDPQFRLGNGTLTLTGMDHGDLTEASVWSDFTLRATNPQDIPVRVALNDGPFGPNLPLNGSRLPSQPMHLGDQLRLCLDSTSEWDSRIVGLEVHVDPVHHGDLTRIMQVGRVPLC